MAPPRRPSVDTLRYAAARAVERSSLRAAARKMGMAASWLNAFIENRIQDVRSQTARKLREWFIRESAALSEVDEVTAGASVALLVEGLLDEADRTEAAAELVATLAREYEQRQGSVPHWLRALMTPE